MSAISLLLLHGLAVGVISLFLTKEDGPMEIFRRLRYLAGINIFFDQQQRKAVGGAGQSYCAASDMNANNFVYISNGSFFGDLLSCDRCTATWVSLFFLPHFTIMAQYHNYHYMVYLLSLPVWWLAVTGVSILFNRVVS